MPRRLTFYFWETTPNQKNWEKLQLFHSTLKILMLDFFLWSCSGSEKTYVCENSSILGCMFCKSDKNIRFSKHTAYYIGLKIKLVALNLVLHTIHTRSNNTSNEGMIDRKANVFIGMKRKLTQASRGKHKLNSTHSYIYSSIHNKNHETYVFDGCWECPQTNIHCRKYNVNLGIQNGNKSDQWRNGQIYEIDWWFCL